MSKIFYIISGASVYIAIFLLVLITRGFDGEAAMLILPPIFLFALYTLYRAYRVMIVYNFLYLLSAIFLSIAIITPSIFAFSSGGSGEARMIGLAGAMFLVALPVGGLSFIFLFVAVLVHWRKTNSNIQSGRNIAGTAPLFRKTLFISTLVISGAVALFVLYSIRRLNLLNYIMLAF